MKRITVIMLMMISLFSLTGCDWFKTYRPSGDWRITNQELFDEHFPKYIEYVLSVVDEYDFEYEHTVSNVSRNKDQSLQLELCFTDGYTMKFMFWDENFTYGSFYIRLWKDSDTFEEAIQTPYEYFEIMHKVNEFSVVNLGGNENTFQELLERRIEIGDDIENHLQKYRYWEGESLGWSGYELGIRFFSTENQWYTNYRFQGYLTDQNIWEEKAS